jgi:hypothetical protein
MITIRTENGNIHDLGIKHSSARKKIEKISTRRMRRHSTNATKDRWNTTMRDKHVLLMIRRITIHHSQVFHVYQNKLSFMKENEDGIKTLFQKSGENLFYGQNKRNMRFTGC